MARIKPDDIVDDLECEFRGALVQAVKEVLPDSDFDDDELFRAFHRAVDSQCGVWEQVGDSHVEIS